MKKTLLSVLLAASVGLSASAFGLQRMLPAASNPSFVSARAPEAVEFPAALKAPSRADSLPTMDFNLSSTPYQALGFNGQTNGDRFSSAICMNEANTTLFAGNQITSINFYTGVANIQTSQQQINYVTDYTVFLTYDLQGERLVEQKFTASHKAFALQTAVLDKPFTIEPGKELYIGWECSLKSSNDLTIVIDGVNHGDDIDGGWVANFDKTKNEFVWDNIASYYGFNCISATIEGETLPVNAVNISDMAAPSNVEVGAPFRMQALIYNKASNNIENIELTYTIGDAQPVSDVIRFNEGFTFGQGYVINIENASYDKAGTDVPVKCVVTKVNGEANTIDGSFEFTMNFLAPGTGFKANMVTEEITSTYCGYCPLGLSYMEKMTENHPDDFFLVTVHGNMSAYQRDPMTTSSFSKVISNYSSGFPAGVINRSISCDPRDIESYEDYYTTITSSLVPYYVGAECELSADSTTVTVKTETKFSMDTDNSTDRYQLAYVLTEDHVGPYNQSNYYSGQTGDLDGWDKKPSSVYMLYDNVGRLLDGFPGVAKSLPATFTALTAAEGTRTITIPTNVSNVKNMNVLVYLVDTNSGEILNAARVKSADIKVSTTAITEVETDNTDAPVEYFNLQGVRVDNPSNGLFIRRQGSKVTKVIR